MATSRHSNKVLPPDNGAPQQSRCNPPSAGLVVRQSLLGAARTTDASLPETAAAMVTIALTPRQKRGAHPPTVRRAVRRGGDRGACQDRRLAPWRGLNPELGLSSGRRVSPKANPRAGVPCSLPRGRPALLCSCPRSEAPRTRPRTLPEASVRAARLGSALVDKNRCRIEGR